MARFFVAASNIFGGVAYISGRDAEHMRVLRLREGEIVVVCDGKGTDYKCRVSKAGGADMEAEIIGSEPSAGEPTVSCRVYAAFPKGDKAETIVQKCVELGASAVVFFPSERCVSKPSAAALIKKTERWRLIAEEAAKQSGRGVIPEVSAAASFEAAISEAARAELCMFFYEGGGDISIKDALAVKCADIKTVSVITGPEGGFEPCEVEAAREAGALVTSMGSRILRCETAPLCALTSVMLMTGNL